MPAGFVRGLDGSDASRRVAVLLLGFAALQTAFALLGFADGDLLADDAYYYFQIARHAALGRGLSFDGIHLTNGFHPLYAWLLVPLFAVAKTSLWGPVHAALVLLGLCAAGTGWLLYQLGRATLSERAGEAMALFFVTSPFAWLLPLRGTEEALGTALLVAGAVQVARLDRVPSPRGAAGLGLLLGLAMLARTEYVLWAAPVCLWLLWRTRSVATVLLCGGVASAVVSPWLIWNFVHFGTIFQVSGAVKTSIDIFGRFPSLAEPLAWLWNGLLPFERSARFVVGEEFTAPRTSWLLLAALAGLLGAASWVAGARRVPSALALLYAFVALHLAFYGYVMRHYFVWYFLPVAAVLAVFLGERLSTASRLTLGSFAALSTLVCGGTLAAWFANADWQPGSTERRIARETRALRGLPEGSRVGLWNAGAYGYVSGFLHPELRVVNLDGLVNNEIFAAHQRGEYAAWVAREIDYIAEAPEYLLLYMGRRQAQELLRHASYLSRDPVLIQLRKPGEPLDR